MKGVLCISITFKHTYIHTYTHTYTYVPMWKFWPSSMSRVVVKLPPMKQGTLSTRYSSDSSDSRDSSGSRGSRDSISTVVTVETERSIGIRLTMKAKQENLEYCPVARYIALTEMFPVVCETNTELIRLLATLMKPALRLNREPPKTMSTKSLRLHSCRYCLWLKGGVL
jgi:hypothetical protein